MSKPRNTKRSRRTTIEITVAPAKPAGEEDRPVKYITRESEECTMCGKQLAIDRAVYGTGRGIFCSLDCEAAHTENL